MDEHWRKRGDEWLFKRLEVCNRRLRNTKKYQILCRQQDEREAIAEKYLRKLEEQEQIAVRRFYSYDVELREAETAAAYDQGWNDAAIMVAMMFAEG